MVGEADVVLAAVGPAGLDDAERVVGLAVRVAQLEPHEHVLEHLAVGEAPPAGAEPLGQAGGDQSVSRVGDTPDLGQGQDSIGALGYSLEGLPLGVGQGGEHLERA